jgi:hypothetical protein
MTPHDQTEKLTPYYIMRETLMQALHLADERFFGFQNCKYQTASAQAVSPGSIVGGLSGWRCGRPSRYNRGDQARALPHAGTG